MSKAFIIATMRCRFHWFLQTAKKGRFWWCVSIAVDIPEKNQSVISGTAVVITNDCSIWRRFVVGVKIFIHVTTWSAKSLPGNCRHGCCMLYDIDNLSNYSTSLHNLRKSMNNSNKGDWFYTNEIYLQKPRHYSWHRYEVYKFTTWMTYSRTKKRQISFRITKVRGVNVAMRIFSVCSCFL